MLHVYDPACQSRRWLDRRWPVQPDFCMVVPVRLDACGQIPEDSMRIPLASYGLPEMAVGTVLCLGGGVLCVWHFPALVGLPAAIWVCLLLFFRDPERRCECAPEALLSPADGTVTDVEQVEAPAFLKGRCMRIGIFMSVLNVHVNRSPAAGVVKLVQYCPGRFRDARSGRAKAENEHNLVGLEMPGGQRILINQIAGIIARRIACGVCAGQHLARGQRIGMVKLGSRVELYLALKDHPTVMVRVGARVQAGADVVAAYAHRPAA